MDRRDFITLSALSLGALPSIRLTPPIPRKPQWLLDWIRINDRQMAGYEKYKITDAGHPYAGGYKNDMEIPNPQTTSGFLVKAGTLIACPESEYYRSVRLAKDMEAAARSILRMQHADGTIDLPETNFHSTPDTAFVLENVIPAYEFLKQSATPGAEQALTTLETFLKKAGEALIIGGIHTPNHRWVVSAALTRLHALFPDARYISRIDQWLAEHIDIDPDGQYNEKSTNSYSPIVNRSLIIMAKGLKRPELLEPVRKNLLMTLYYVHPNGEVVTEASNRQDKGTIGTMIRYYYVYRYMALHDQNGQMAALCRLIEDTTTPEQRAGYLTYFLEDPTLWRSLPAAASLPTHYTKAFPYSGVVRIRRGSWDCTLLANNASWLTFHKGQAVLQAMRVAASFFGKGQFQSEKIEKQGEAWMLRQTLEGPYFQPLGAGQIDPDGDWDKMPRSLRQQSEIQKLESTVTVREAGQGLQIDISLTGTDHVPVAVELIFRAGGTLSGVAAHPSKAHILADDLGSYTQGNDTIRFGPGLALHKGIHLRGALPPMEAPTVYLTGFTPFQHTLHLS